MQLVNGTSLKGQSVILVFSVDLPGNFHIISSVSNNPHYEPFGCQTMVSVLMDVAKAVLEAHTIQMIDFVFHRNTFDS